MDDILETANPQLLIELNAFMSEKAVMEATTLSRTSLHRKRLAGRFPEPVPISNGRMGYRIRDIQAWLEDPLGWREESASGSQPGSQGVSADMPEP